MAMFKRKRYLTKGTKMATEAAVKYFCRDMVFHFEEMFH